MNSRLNLMKSLIPLKNLRKNSSRRFMSANFKRGCQKAKWYINRMSVMSFDEINNRFIVFFKQKVSKAKIRLFEKQFSDNNFLDSLRFFEEYKKKRGKNKNESYIKVAKEQLNSIVLQKCNKVFPASIESKNEIVELFKKNYPQKVNNTIKYANQICEHYFDFLGSGKTYLGEEINWHMSFENGKTWQMKYWGDIDYRLTEDMGDIKMPWELSRHQYFFSLGKAYWLTGKEKYAEEFVAQITHWIDNNPKEIGINWIVKLDMAIRMISWAWAFRFFMNAPSFNEDIKWKVLKSIYLQTEHISQYLSFGSSATNHIIGQAAGLFIVGTVFSEFDKSQEWVDKGFNILESELFKQVHEDGVGGEQSTSYLSFILDFYFQALIVGRRTRCKFSKKALNRIEKMCEFLMHLKGGIGTIPNIGDGDEGKGFKVDNNEFQDYESNLSIGAVIFNRPEMKAVISSFGEKAFWLLGKDGLKRYEQLSDCKYIPSTIDFPKGGYFLMSSNGKPKGSMLVDTGPIGYPPSMAHGHADILSFVLSINDLIIIDDPGTFSYLGFSDTRQYFKGTSSHNTIVVDDKSQSEYKNSFVWGKAPKVSIIRKISNKHYDLIDVSHNGYARLTDPVIIRRIIFFLKPSIWIISDLIESKNQHKYELFFHLHPMTALQKDKQGFLLTRTNKQKQSLLAIMLAEETENGKMLFNISVQNAKCWYSERYGKKVPSNIISFKRIAKENCQFNTVLLGEENIGKNCQVYKTHPEAVSILMSGEIVQFYYYNYGDNSKRVEFNDVQFDGKLLYLEKNKAGKTTKIVGSNINFLRVGSKVIHNSHQEEVILGW